MQGQRPRENVFYLLLMQLMKAKDDIFWPDYLVGMINQFSKYPWLGLVLSIRSSYEKLIVPKDFFQ